MSLFFCLCLLQQFFGSCITLLISFIKKRMMLQQLLAIMQLPIQLETPVWKRSNRLQQQQQQQQQRQ